MCKLCLLLSDVVQNVENPSFDLPRCPGHLALLCQRGHRSRPRRRRAVHGGPRDRRSGLFRGSDRGHTSLLSLPLQNSELGGGGGGPIRNKRYISLRVKLLKRQFGLPSDVLSLKSLSLGKDANENTSGSGSKSELALIAPQVYLHQSSLSHLNSYLGLS